MSEKLDNNTGGKNPITTGESNLSKRQIIEQELKHGLPYAVLSIALITGVAYAISREFATPAAVGAIIGAIVGMKITKNISNKTS